MFALNRITNQISTWFPGFINNSWIPVTSNMQQMEILLVIMFLSGQKFHAKRMFALRRSMKLGHGQVPATRQRYLSRLLFYLLSKSVSNGWVMVYTGITGFLIKASLALILKLACSGFCSLMRSNITAQTHSVIKSSCLLGLKLTNNVLMVIFRTRSSIAINKWLQNLSPSPEKQWKISVSAYQ